MSRREQGVGFGFNQATADARILGEVLELAAQSTAGLSQELQEACKQAVWAEQAAGNRVRGWG